MKIACIGQIVFDLILSGVRALPERGTCQHIPFATGSTGGCALNAAGVLDRLGVPCALFGVVGEDLQGHALLGALRTTGIDLRGVLTLPDTPTTTSTIILDEDGERSFLYAPGSVEAFAFHHVQWGLLEDCACWHIPGISKLKNLDLPELMRRGKASGKTITLDADYDADGAWKDILPLLPLVDYFLPSWQEAEAITGCATPAEAAAFLQEHGASRVVIKLGANGCYWNQAEEHAHVPGFPVICRDATGAGDSFLAGFLAGLSAGWDIGACAVFANACGALSVTEIGAGAGVRDRQQVIDFMNEHQRGQGIGRSHVIGE